MTVIEVTSNRWCNSQLSYYLGDKFICTGNGSGKYVMQKSLWCDSLYRQNISNLQFHCQLILVFGDGVLRPHYLVRGCREFKSESSMKITLFSPADQEHVNTAQVVEMVLGNHQGTIQIYASLWGDT